MISNRLLGETTTNVKKKILGESVVPPRPFWCHTTAAHLVLWGLYFGLSTSTDNQAEVSPHLIHAAIALCPIDPVARLAKCQIESESAIEGNFASNLGLSRDAVSLTWSARALRLAGKHNAAIKMCKHAVALKSNPNWFHHLDLSFNDDPTVQRYFLPGEESVRMVIKELINDSAGSFDKWREAVTDSNVATLAMARILQEMGHSEAQKVLEEILKDVEQRDLASGKKAIRRAVCAEAYALLSEWNKAIEQYRLAIDQIDNTTIKRSWWFNVASIATHVSDENQRTTALELVLETEQRDEISRRALELRRKLAHVGRIRTSGAKAN
jgi:tetratricopeptide (TPR) repeat protein